MSADARPGLEGQPMTDSTPDSVTRMMIAVIQVQDIQRALRALKRKGLSITRLPSTGAFLGMRNVTLLLGYPESMESDVFSAIQKTCHQRVEYISTPLEGAPLPFPLSTPVTVGGATVFTFDVDRFEEF
jgi:uncharacterized protein YaaQ